METVMKLSRLTLTTVKVIFFLTSFVFWGLAIYDSSKLQYVIAVQMSWIFLGSATSYFLIGNSDEYDELSRVDMLLWLLNFWATIIVSGVAWGMIWGLAVLAAMFALVALGSCAAFYLGKKQSNSDDAQQPIGFGN